MEGFENDRLVQERGALREKLTDPTGASARGEQKELEVATEDTPELGGTIYFKV